MSLEPGRQQDRALVLLRRQGMVRLSEFTKAGITAATLSRMVRKAMVVQPGRGLYQLPDAGGDAAHDLALAAKLVPNGVVCLVSALAFHELTDSIPPRIWMALGPKDRKPAVTQPAFQFVRFGGRVRHAGIEEHAIEGVTVRMYSPAKTVVDLFRYRQQAGVRFQKSPGLNLALEGMSEALRQRKATPSAIAAHAHEAGVWKALQPYLEAMTINA
jgi:predicted transcriptional regulator of viral defense system